MILTDIDQHRGLVIHSGGERVTAEDILSATRHWFTHPDFDPRAPVIWNFETSLLELSLEEMSRSYSMVRDAVSAKRTGGRTAWVHPSAMVRAMIDIVAKEFDWGSDWRTFQNIKDAEAWCLEDH